jgi:hypothetical protein
MIMQHSTFPPTPDPALTPRHEAALAAVAQRIADLNQAICEAVDTGLSIELQRSARHHCGGGNWGDLMRPVIVKRS